MEKSTNDKTGKLPRYVARCGAVSATAWSATKTINGELREMVQVELVKNYRDANDKWQKTHRFWPEDLPAVMAVAQRAYEELKMREQWPAAQMDHERTASGACEAEDRDQPAGRP